MTCCYCGAPAAWLLSHGMRPWPLCDAHLPEARRQKGNGGQLVRIGCRVCGSRSLSTVLDLGMMPLANGFGSEDRYPLKALWCASCLCLQLADTLDPAVMFDDYPYRSSMSETFVAAARDHVTEIVGRITPGDLVVEIGSNDGYLLQHYQDQRVLGVDPAANIDAPVETWHAYFSETVAAEIVAAYGPARVIHANNVAAHIPACHDFFAGLDVLLADDGEVWIETPHVVELVNRGAFDTIYHEHVFVWSLNALDHVAWSHHLKVLDVEPLEVHGGSLRVRVGRHGDPTRRVADIKAVERALDVTTLGTNAERVRSRLAGMVADLRAQGKRVCGYGAAAKGTIMLHACGLTDLDFVADITPTKQGLTMPGTSIPIVAPSRLAEADVAVLLCWNFAAEVQAREAWWHGRWLLPVPEPALLERVA